jgi:hypothetical protein
VAALPHGRPDRMAEDADGGVTTGKRPAPKMAGPAGA